MIPVGNNQMGALGLNTICNNIRTRRKYICKSNNKISDFLNDSYNLTNTLVHEYQHKIQTTKQENRPIPLRENRCNWDSNKSFLIFENNKRILKNTMSYLY